MSEVTDKTPEKTETSETSPLHSAAQLVEQLAALLLERKARMTTAESCTGGLIAGALTDMPGSSAWFEQAVVTYSNDSKQALLGVPASVLEEHGAVSEACVLAMARGVQQLSGANVAVAASGIAGPDGAVPGKPVGTVWLAWAVEENVTAELLHLQGDRAAVREQAVLLALRGTIARILENRVHPENGVIRPHEKS